MVLDELHVDITFAVAILSYAKFVNVLYYINCSDMHICTVNMTPDKN